MSSSSIINKLKDFDGYPKTLDDFRIRTLGGGAVTVISYGIMLLLFILELDTFLTPDVTEELFVDTTRDPKLQIHLNITVPRIPCKHLSLDAMDSSGEQHLQIEHNIYKVTIDKDGKPVRDPEKEIISTESSPKCGTCYGAESKELNITCCNTCEEVREAYAKRGWGPIQPDVIEQCKDVGKHKFFSKGCSIYGSMEVNRVGGSFHISPGESFTINHVHVHDIQPYSAVLFNTTHEIHHLSFGINIPGKTNPLDGVVGVIVGGMVTYQYYIKIVPTIYVYDDTGRTILTNQFSVTRHHRLEVHSGRSPGIFFNYELAPIMVKYTEKKRSFGHFVTNICAIIGGVFTVASLIDGFLYRSVQALQRKVEIGKGY